MSEAKKHYFRREDDISGVTIVFFDDKEVRSFSEVSGNRDYENFLIWLSEGNTPEPWPPAE